MRVSQLELDSAKKFAAKSLFRLKNIKEKVFVWLRLGLLELDLAQRFGIQATVSRIVTTWINLLYHTFKGIDKFPSWHTVKKKNILTHG